MHVQRYADPAVFEAAVYDFLIAREAEHNLFFGILSELKRNLHQFGEETPYMAAVESNGAIIGAALRTPPANFHLSHQTDPAALRLLAEDAHDRFPTMSGTNGRSDLAASFADIWATLTGQAYERTMAMRIYALEAVTSPADMTGTLRRATTDDRELLIDWMHGFHTDIGDLVDRERSAATVKRYLESGAALRGLYLWEINGQPVSMAGYAGPTPHGIRIGAVYTPPEHRRQGYASRVVAALSQHLLDQGRTFCFLYTDLANPTSNHIYQDIGYQPICDAAAYDYR